MRNEIAVYDNVTDPALWEEALEALQSIGTYTIPTNNKEVKSPNSFFPDDMVKYYRSTGATKNCDISFP